VHQPAAAPSSHSPSTSHQPIHPRTSHTPSTQTHPPLPNTPPAVAGGTLAYQGTDGFGAWQDLWAIEYSDIGLPGVAWIEMYLTVPEGMSASLKFTDMRIPTQTLTVYDADQESIIMEANCIKDYATLDEAAADGNTTDAAVAYASKFFSSGELILGAGYHQFYIRMVARVADVAEVGLSARVDLSEWRGAVHSAACCCLLLPAAACCCLLLPAAACCCLLLPAAACCCLHIKCTG
jgi:hypothetical protein